MVSVPKTEYFSDTFLPSREHDDSASTSLRTSLFDLWLRKIDTACLEEENNKLPWRLAVGTAFFPILSRSIISIFIHPLFLLVTRRTLCGREIVAKIGVKLFQRLWQEIVAYFRDLSLYFG